MSLSGREWEKSVNPKKASRSMMRIVKNRNHCKWGGVEHDARNGSEDEPVVDGWEGHTLAGRFVGTS